ncbi:MAG: F0F1 ATP synthase subunit epsilon [Candidatus Schekmanbacteria bacterium]|nr:MAG: F0F1 ATP synthase subunit epsilon [Candidatus Schekmanbacteria bacterium]
MADNIFLEIVTPEKMVVSEDVKEVTAPGINGEFGVLPEHTPFLSVLKSGHISYVTLGGEVKKLAVSWGYAEVRKDAVIILAETAERPEEIDVQRAEEARKRAEKRLSSGGEDIDVERAELALARAMARLELVGKI